MERIEADTRLGRYVLVELLGAGGMAQVWRARDEQLHRDVAIKVVRPDLAVDPEFRERFLREARLVATLDHPHVVPIWDCGETDDHPWIVMPLLEGGTLADLIRSGPFSPSRAAEMLEPLGQALDAAHAAGILHRDVKPANVLVGADGRLLLADFGIARLTEATSHLTRTGMVVGTPLYMAPEVATGGKAGPASDRYSLAVVLYEMLAGRPPFEGENPLSILHQHAMTPAPPLRSRIMEGDRSEALDPALDSIFERALHKRPEERPDTCRAMIAAVTGAEPVVSGRRPPDDPERTLLLPRHVAAGRRSRSGLVIALFLTLIAAAVWVARPGREGGSMTPRPSATPTDTPSSSPGATPTDTPAEEPEREVVPPPSRPGASPVVEAPPASTTPTPLPPTATGESTRPAPSGKEHWNGRQARDLRNLDRRPDRATFEAILSEAGTRHEEVSWVSSLELWAKGGLALLENRDDDARTSFAHWSRDEDFLRALGPGGPTIVASRPSEGPLADWEVALAYHDPLQTVARQLAPLLRGEASAGYPILSRAVIARLDDESETAARLASLAWERLPSSESTLREAAALLAAHASGQRDRPDESLRWLARAVDSSGLHRGAAAMSGMQVARRLGRLLEAKRFQKVACAEGVDLACRSETPERRPPGRRRGSPGSRGR